MKPVFAIALLMLCAGCERVTRDMADQPRYNVAASSPLFADSQAMRSPVAGTVAHSTGDLALISSGRAGRVNDSQQGDATDAQRQRGRERYAIYCQPCHGTKGQGDGEVVRRGFPAPPPIGAIALRTASDAQLHDAIRNGVGVMLPFADRVSANDAWAIVAYLRELQRAPATVASSSSGATR